jgi:agmatinase
VSGADRDDPPRLSPAADWYEPLTPEGDFDLAMHVGGATFQKLPLVADAAELAQRAPDVAIVGAPMDEGDTNRPGARFGPRAIRLAQYNVGSIYAQQAGVEPFALLDVVDAGDAPCEPALLEHNHRAIYRKTRAVADSGAVPITLGGDHSIGWPVITAVAEARWPLRLGVIHFDAHTDTGADGLHKLPTHGKPMRRLVDAGAVQAPNFVQVGLRGYWPGREVLDWMDQRGFKRHPMDEIEQRGIDAVVDDAIREATDGTDAVYLSVDVDVLEPAMAPGTGTPEPGGLLTRELLRSIRRVVGAVRLAGADVVEVSPPYDHAEVTAATAHRCALECVVALAGRRARGEEVRFEPRRSAG